MPSRRLRVARRFCSSSSADSCDRTAGGTAAPSAMPRVRSSPARSASSRSAVRGVGDAVEVAGAIVAAATDDAKALTAERDEAERTGLLRTLGIAEGAAVPPAVRSQLSALEDEQKRSATRSLRDGIDRVLTDLESMFRDVLLLQFGRDADLINRELEPDLRALAAAWTPERTLTVVDRIGVTRENLELNAAPALALESMLVTVASGRIP